MRLGIAKESRPGERRVALVPETLGRLGDGIDVIVEAGAGDAADFPDAAYRDGGAEIGDPWSAEVVAKVAAPTPGEAERLRSGQVLIAFLDPLTDTEGIERLASAGVLAFALESVPRITRAQPMDALSSQATVAGYKAALIAADRLPRFLPMLMTAAGTIPPAKVLVLGAGVAGLQAIATARRLGAVVSAFDVRPAVPRRRRTRRRNRRRLCARAHTGAAGRAAGGAADAHPVVRRVDHHRCRPRSSRAEADHGGRGARDARGIRDRRPRRGVRRKLRADRPGQGDRRERSDDRRLDEPAFDDAHARKPAALAQHRVARGAVRTRRQARPRLGRRDRRGRVRDASGGTGMSHTATLVAELTVLVLAIFLGFEVISKVPTMLHTPLMSGTNAIHGIVIVGALIVAGSADQDPLIRVIGFVAVALAAANVVGGFVVTDRMLEMFKKRRSPDDG
jgi:NAD/NADP transhydrogenase alpha subunit